MKIFELWSDKGWIVTKSEDIPVGMNAVRVTERELKYPCEVCNDKEFTICTTVNLCVDCLKKITDQRSVHPQT